jgi:hypothetical protein
MPPASTAMSTNSTTAKVASAESNMSKGSGAGPFKMAGFKAVPQSARHGFRTK